MRLRRKRATKRTESDSESERASRQADGQTVKAAAESRDALRVGVVRGAQFRVHVPLCLVPGAISAPGVGASAGAGP